MPSRSCRKVANFSCSFKLWYPKVANKQPLCFRASFKAMTLSTGCSYITFPWRSAIWLELQYICSGDRSGIGIRPDPRAARLGLASSDYSQAKFVSCHFTARRVTRGYLNSRHVQFCRKPCAPIAPIATLSIELSVYLVFSVFDLGMSGNCRYHVIASSPSGESGCASLRPAFTLKEIKVTVRAQA